jgi:inorganic pyrophosphatase
MQISFPSCFGDTKGQVNIIIETPANNRNKYAYDSNTGLFKLKKTLPSGLVFPCAMGFLPNTRGEDGDPLDVLVMMHGDSFPGCLVTCLLLGVIRVKQHENRKTIENDRFVAVPADMPQYEHIDHIKKLNGQQLDEIIFFLEIYNQFENIKVDIASVSGPEIASRLIKKQII